MSRGTQRSMFPAGACQCMIPLDRQACHAGPRVRRFWFAGDLAGMSRTHLLVCLQALLSMEHDGGRADAWCWGAVLYMLWAARSRS